jgi:hypothetical protein
MEEDYQARGAETEPLMEVVEGDEPQSMDVEGATVNCGDV